jgi:hypothetical protein
MDHHGWEFLVDRVGALITGVAWPAALVIILSRHLVRECAAILLAIAKKIEGLHRIKGRGISVDFIKLPQLPTPREINDDPPTTAEE